MTHRQIERTLDHIWWADRRARERRGAFLSTIGPDDPGRTVHYRNSVG